jgi:hypothetical protein
MREERLGQGVGNVSEIRPACIKPEGDRVHDPLVEPEVVGRLQHRREP